MEALRALEQLEPALLEQHADALVTSLEDPNEDVREAAFLALSKRDPAWFAQHVDVVVAMLEDSSGLVRNDA